MIEFVLCFWLKWFFFDLVWNLILEKGFLVCCNDCFLCFFLFLFLLCCCCWCWSLWLLRWLSVLIFVLMVILLCRMLSLLFLMFVVVVDVMCYVWCVRMLRGSVIVVLFLKSCGCLLDLVCWLLIIWMIVVMISGFI